MTHTKFQDVPKEPDTRVLSRKPYNVGGYEALHERWSWDGIKGETLIFVSSEVSSLGDANLRKLLSESELFEADSQVTIKRSDSGYTFVNFNFRY